MTQTGGCCLQLEVGKWNIINSTLANYAAVGRDTTHPVVYVSNKAHLIWGHIIQKLILKIQSLMGALEEELREYQNPDFS